MSRIEWLVDRAMDHRRSLLLVLLLVTAALGAGAPQVEQTSSMEEFRTDSPEQDKLDYIQDNFGSAGDTTTVQVVVQSDNALGRDAMIETLEFQRALTSDERIEPTLANDTNVTGVANVVARASLRRERAGELEARQAELARTESELSAALDRVRNGEETVESSFETARSSAPVDLTDRHFQSYREAARALQAAENESEVEAAYRAGTRGVLAEEYRALSDRRASLERGVDAGLREQQRQLESMDDDEFEELLETVFESPDDQLLSLMPADYEPGETQASATVFVVFQDAEGEVVTPDAAPQGIVDSQEAIQDLAEDRSDPSFVVFGHGITTGELNSSMEDSFAVVGPLALLFVLLVLFVAYRDLVDIVLGLFGLATVLVWTLGFMGWVGIDFGLIFIAVPVLLIGLSVDYAIHVFMRGREAQERLESGVERATRVGLAGVALALILVTVTTAAGFLSNLVSSMPPIREFGLVNAVGIVAALLVFGVLVPALKVEIDAALESRGIDRKNPAFGTSGRVERLLRIGETLAWTAPAAVLLVALLVSAGGVYGAANADSSFSTEEFLAEDPPDWTDRLPAAMEPDEYRAADTIDYLDETFLRQEIRTQLLLEGDPTDPEFLLRVQSAERQAANASSTATLPDGDAAVRSPLSAMEQVAETNETFRETLEGADTDGDGVPDSNLETVYGEFFDADRETATGVLHRTDDGEYVAARLIVYADGSANRGDITDDMQGIADDVDGAGVTVTATGDQTVLYHLTEQEILDTVMQTFFITLGAVTVFLMAVFRVTSRRASLGVVAIVPVVMALSWTFGSLYLMGYTLNALTGMITSLTIGLGVAYSIHVTQRYQHKLASGASVPLALRVTVTGTGGALLGSAATTAGGFGVLAFAFIPVLQQFGIILALSIVYAFLASVLVLPSLLIVWTSLFASERARQEVTTNFGAPQLGSETHSD